MPLLLRRAMPLVWAVGMSILLSVGIIVGLCFVGLIADSGLPIRWEIPAGYRGWVVVMYEDLACQALRRDGIYDQVIRVDANGCGCTSSSEARGWRVHHYDYVAADGSRVRIPHFGSDDDVTASPGYTAPRQQAHPFPLSVYFVGSKEDLKGWGEGNAQAGYPNRQRERACQQVV
jgi:hypothetical protein